MVSSSTAKGSVRRITPRMASKPFNRLALLVLVSSARMYSFACAAAEHMHHLLSGYMRTMHGRNAPDEAMHCLLRKHFCRDDAEYWSRTLLCCF